MKTITLKHFGLGRYADVSPFPLKIEGYRERLDIEADYGGENAV